MVLGGEVQKLSANVACVFVLVVYVFGYLHTVLKSFINHVIYHTRYVSLIQSCKYHHYNFLFNTIYH